MQSSTASPPERLAVGRAHLALVLLVVLEIADGVVPEVMRTDVTVTGLAVLRLVPFALLVACENRAVAFAAAISIALRLLSLAWAYAPELVGPGIGANPAYQLWQLGALGLMMGVRVAYWQTLKTTSRAAGGRLPWAMGAVFVGILLFSAGLRGAWFARQMRPYEVGSPLGYLAEFHALLSSLTQSGFAIFWIVALVLTFHAVRSARTAS